MGATERIGELARTRRAYAREAASREDLRFGGTSSAYWAGMADAYETALDIVRAEVAASYNGPERRRSSAEREADRMMGRVREAAAARMVARSFGVEVAE